MTWTERQTLLKLTDDELKKRIGMADVMIREGIKEGVGLTKLEEVERQRKVILNALKDKRQARKRKPLPEGVVVKLKTISLFGNTKLLS